MFKRGIKGDIMMNKYSHWIGKLFGFINREKNFAVTIGQTTYYSCSQSLVDNEWRRHEDCHKAQWRSEGNMKFFFKYFYYNIRYGYINNPYEIEARNAEKI